MKIFSQRTAVFCCATAALAALFLHPAPSIAQNPARGSDTVIVVGEYDYPPYSFLDSDGTPAGFTVQLTRAIARVMGLQVDIRLGPWAEIRQGLEDGSVDIIQGMYFSEERDKTVDFSQPFTVVDHAVFARTDAPGVSTLEDIRDTEIIVMQGDIMHDYVREQGLTRKVFTAATPADALALLADGRHDFALIAEVPGLYWIRELELDNVVTVGPPVLSSRYCYAVRQGDGELLSKFSRGLTILRQSGTYHELYEEWFGILKPAGMTREQVFKLIALILGPCLFVLAAVLLWVRLLKVRVREKTRQLELTQHAFDNASVSTFWISPEGTFIYVNEHACNKLGYSRDELIGMHVQDIDPDHSQDMRRDRWNDYKVKGFVRFESQHRTKDGRLFPVEVTSNFISFEKQEYEIAFAQDISERKKAEDTLQRIQYSVNRVQDTILWVDGNGCFIDFNESACSNLGYSRRELLEMHVADVDPLFPREKWPAHWEAMKQHSFMTFESLHKTKDGRTYPVELFIHNQQFRDIHYNFVVARDITEKKAAQTALHESQQRLQAILDNIPEMIMQVDRNLQIMWANKAALAMNPEAVGKTCYRAFVGRERPCFNCPVFKCLSTGTLETNIIQQQSAEGMTGESWWQTTGIPLKDAQGEVVGAIEIGRNITEEKLAEEELQQAQKMEAIGTLAGGIAHDFNNMLGVIMGNTELLLEDCAPGTEASWSAGQIREAALKARDLVKQILTFSRRTQQNMTSLSMAPLVKEALKMLRATIPSTIEIVQQVECPQDGIVGDATQIHQVLMNLCVNAEHAMHESGGTLAVTLKNCEIAQDEVHQDLRAGMYVELLVSDSGHGIEPEIMDRIFDPFFTTKEVDRGTGLGLSVVHGIVKNHGGAIEVASEIGTGTTFRVLLPVAASAEKDEGAVSKQDMPGGSERIMLVDDEQTVLMIAERMLKKQGYAVSAFSNSEAALEAFQTSPQTYDLVITDMTMPRMTGKTLAREVLKLRPDIPVILCTGYSDLISEAACERIGVRALMMKPYNRLELSIRVREVFDRS